VFGGDIAACRRGHCFTAAAKGAKFYSTACRNANRASQSWAKLTIECLVFFSFFINGLKIPPWPARRMAPVVSNAGRESLNRGYNAANGRATIQPSRSIPVRD
jgi:hypothetical protein